jgi:hypothetical protein
METKVAPPKTKVAPIVLDLASELSCSAAKPAAITVRGASQADAGASGWCCRTYVEGTNADQI